MATRTWYVTDSGTKVNFGAAITGGVTNVAIYKVVEGDETSTGPRRFRKSLWRAAGSPVAADLVAAAAAAQPADAVPTEPNRAGAYSKPATAKDLRSVASTSVSGAVTVDARAAAVHVLTVTGNITSFTVTGLADVAGKTFEVHFVQDTTGGRTLAGVNTSAVKLAGGALALSSGAGKRDVLRLRVVGGVAVEAGRSTNV